MLNTLKLLNRKWFVKSQDIIKIKQGQTVYYLKCNVLLIDNSELFIEEKLMDGILEYSYHWQDERKKLIKRWDNAPHYKEISTFPHHIHEPDIGPSFSPSFSSVLKEIEQKIKEKQELKSD